jgi:methanethiol oxidase
MQRRLATTSGTVALALGLALTACAGLEEDASDPDEGSALDEAEAGGNRERFMYIATIAQSPTDPDFIAVVGTDPTKSDFGQIVNRVDMPNIGDELHHFGYSRDQERLIVPGLFSGRVYVFEIGRGDDDDDDGDDDDESGGASGADEMELVATNEDLVADSGYTTPHSVMVLPQGQVAVTMLGSDTPTTSPAGIVTINDHNGNFAAYFGPPPTNRPPGTLGPNFMYDVDGRADSDRLISTTFGPPGICGAAVNPACLGDEVAVWRTSQRKVIQVASLGTNSGALEVRFIEKPGVRRALINTPGTSAVWVADDDDKNGLFDFTQVLGPEDGINIPADMMLSYDNKFMFITNWFGNTVQVFRITDPFNPVLTDTVDIPHPNMLRMSRDQKRLYVTNGLLTTWDNDPNLGGPRNNEYGVWLFNFNTTSGTLTSITPDGSSWIDFTNVQKATTSGPAGPHMMFFDPSIRLVPGEH